MRISYPVRNSLIRRGSFVQEHPISLQSFHKVLSRQLDKAPSQADRKFNPQGSKHNPPCRRQAEMFAHILNPAFQNIR